MNNLPYCQQVAVIKLSFSFCKFGIILIIESLQFQSRQRQLAETEKALDNIMRAVEQGLFNSKTQERMLQLESEKADLLWRIDSEKLDIPLKLDVDEIIFWLESFAKGDLDDPKYRERLADASINKIILWNNRMIIVYNVKEMDGEKVSVEEIISAYEHEKEKNPVNSGFNSEQCGQTVRKVGTNPTIM